MIEGPNFKLLLSDVDKLKDEGNRSREPWKLGEVGTSC